MTLYNYIEACPDQCEHCINCSSCQVCNCADGWSGDDCCTGSQSNYLMTCTYIVGTVYDTTLACCVHLPVLMAIM